MLLYYYAPNAVDELGELSGSGVADVIGCPIKRGVGNHTFASEFRASASSSGVASSCPDFSLLAGEHYEPTVSSQPGPPTGPSAVLDPWYYMDEDAADAAGCRVLARYADTDKPSTSPAAAVCRAQEDSTTILTAAPLPAAALRLVAEAAGVHIFLNTSADVRTTTCNGDGVEAAGAGLLIRAGVTAESWTPRQVALPPSTAGWSVRDEAGEMVCQHCAAFTVALGPGQVAAFVVEPEQTVL